MTSITAALGSGSGLDTKALVEGLVKAQFEVKTKALTQRTETLTSQITALGKLKSGLTGFSTALGTLIGSGTLATQPASGDANVFKVSTTTGATLGALSHQVEVRALATAQSLSSVAVAGGPGAASGTGTLTIRLGTPAYDPSGGVTGFAPKPGASAVTVAIGPGQNSLAGLAAAINGAKAGVTASVIGDGASSRLAIRGETGEASGFTIEAAEGDVPGLSRFAFGTSSSTMTVGQRAADAIVALDGIAVSRPTNSVTDLVPGATIGLVAAAPGKPVSLTSTPPTAAIKQAVEDFTALFNELGAMLRTETDPVNGTLSGDPAARAMLRQMGALTSTRLAEPTGPGAPSTLAEIGVRTERNGSLGIDAAALQRALTTYPDAVEAMFNPRQASSSPLATVASAAGKAGAGSYALKDLTPATAGRLTGSAVPDAFASPVVIDAANAAIGLSINGGSPVRITLAQGSYPTGEALAAAINAAIQAEPLAAGRASVGWADDRFTLRSGLEGAGSSVALTAGDPTLAARIGVVGATSHEGVAASGTIAGMPALYAGGVFTADPRSPAAGLMVRVAGPVADAVVRIDAGLGAALKTAAERLTDSRQGLGASESRYTALRTSLAKEQAKASEAAERMTTQLTRNFAAMDARVAAYKATGSFLDQQIKAWTRDG